MQVITIDFYTISIYHNEYSVFCVIDKMSCHGHNSYFLKFYLNFSWKFSQSFSNIQVSVLTFIIDAWKALRAKSATNVLQVCLTHSWWKSFVSACEFLNVFHSLFSLDVLQAMTVPLYGAKPVSSIYWGF